MKIKECQLKNTRFLTKLVKGTSVTLATGSDCFWFLAIEAGQIVGAVCAKGEAKRSWRFKSDIVAVHYRGTGVYRKLWDARMDFVNKQGWESLTSYSNLNSRPMYIKEGFIEVSDQGFDHMYMVKENEIEEKSDAA